MSRSPRRCSPRSTTATPRSPPRSCRGCVLYALSHVSLAFLTLDTFLTLRFSLSQGLSARGLRISEKDLGQAFAATDQDGGGTLVFAEWQSSGLATAVDAIAEYATPGAGVLTIDQARRKLTDIGVPPPKINRAVRVMDADRTFSGEHILPSKPFTFPLYLRLLWHICHPNPSICPVVGSVYDTCMFPGVGSGTIELVEMAEYIQRRRNYINERLKDKVVEPPAPKFDLWRAKDMANPAMAFGERD